MASGLDFFIFNFEFVTSIVSKWDAPQLMNVPNASFWEGLLLWSSLYSQYWHCAWQGNTLE